MIITSTSAAAALPFTPSFMVGMPNAPVFMLRAGDVLEREAMERDLAGEYLAPVVWPWALHQAIVDGFAKLGGDSAPELIALQEADFNATGGGEDTLSDDDRTILTGALGQLAQHWPPYRLLVAQQERRKSAIPLVAFRRYCCGWENVDTAFAIGIDRQVTAAALAGVDPTLLRVAGWTAYNLQFGGGQEKNSDALSKSDAAPATSNMGAPSTAGGSSETTNMTKTPGSSSRAGRSSSSTSGRGRARKRP